MLLTVGSNCSNRCSPKSIGVIPSNIAVLVVDIARLRRRSPDIAGLCVKTITRMLLEPRVFLWGQDSGKHHTSNLLPVSDHRVQDLKPYYDLCM